MTALPWWQEAVVYQIYPRSFCDTDGDGIGDLEGVRRHLDHIVALGADTIWLSPIFVSPMADFGYDVSDYEAIDPVFGDLDDFDRLLADAHGRGLRLILDWVPNHTSDQHPWFVSARGSTDSPHRDWYTWRPPGPDGGPPNNWRRAFSPEPAWTFDEASGEYYLHLFLAEQPDLNWANPDVESAMTDTLRFWLDRGVDGFRADVVHCIGKDPTLPDNPDEVAAIPHCALNDVAETHELLRRIRSVLDRYHHDPMMVGEVYLFDTNRVATYYGDGDELHLCFNFPPLHAPWKADSWRKQIEIAEGALNPRGAWPTWVLSNHDVVRHRTRYGSDARARAAAVLLTSLRGTPFLYAGEELGLHDAAIPDDRVVDPGGRDGCRAPLPWTSAPDHGWAGDPWLPWAPAPDEHNPVAQNGSADSMLSLYHRLLELRRGSPALTHGDLRIEPAPDGVLAYSRHHDGEHLLVLINFTDVPVGTGASGAVMADSSSNPTPEHGGRVPMFEGTLEPDQAVILTTNA